jgi:putative two-component system response regulator
MGARVLSGGASEALARAEQIARHHHERWDGTGYPSGLQGNQIPVGARIVHVADVYDVLVHERPYRESFTPEAAAAEIAQGAGSEFDPEVARAFARL